MKILIVGYGFVGQAVGNALKEKHRVVIVDPKITENKIADFPDVDGIIVCVPTPGDYCDISAVRDVLEQIPIHIPILIKSTVTPDRLAEIIVEFPGHIICYSPEFLRAVNANKDFATQKFMIIGGLDPDHFWRTLFQSVLAECKLYFDCSYAEASMAKYSINSFLAIKVSFFNQVYEMCKQNGADFEIVRQMLSHDTRVGSSHTLVPGTDGRRGFGGACFPKDTKSFINYANCLNTPITVLEESVKYNDKIR
jgi:UDPglucose 6-dehydrogenase